MRKVVVGLCFVAIAAVSSEAGVVTFTPLDASVPPGTPAVFQLAVSSTDIATFDSVNLLIGSNTAGIPLDFDYDAAWVASTTVAPGAPGPFGVWASDIFGSGNRFVPPTDPTAWRAPLTIGTLTIDTSGMAVDSFFDVFVDGAGETDLFGSPLSNVGSGLSPLEPLQGSARINIVPEPATLSLLGLGLMGFIRRRFGA